MPTKHSDTQKQTNGRTLAGRKPASRRLPASITPTEETRILTRRDYAYAKPKPTRH